MLILLPPSEGKAEPRSRTVLDLHRLSLPALTPAREQVLDALITLCAGDEDKALAVLGLSPGLRPEIARNARLRTAATLPAGQVYTGVLYEALDLPTLDRPASALARRWIMVASGLWGAVRLGDRIPTYRCPIGVSLPGLGTLSAHWRAALPAVMREAAGGGLVLDLRSAAYAAMWTPPRELARRTVSVQVLQERTVAGVTTRSVVSHFNKATKGRLVRDLLCAGANPRTPNALISTLRDLGYVVEIASPSQLSLILQDPATAI
jgi:cytoplasmic iron level regulating protein YaaA (DUF328/UPF0246 family)